MSIRLTLIKICFLLILTVASIQAKSTGKDLIVDNVYTSNENENVDLKCPIELSKQPTKDEMPSNRQSTETTEQNDLEYSDYVDNSDENNKSGEDENKDSAELKVKRSDQLFIVQWFKDTSRVGKQHARFRQDGVYLRITNVSASDAGKYKCKLINGFGSVTTTLRLNVVTMVAAVKTTTSTTTTTVVKTKSSELVRAPVFTNPERMQPRDFRKKKGSQVRFRCRATGLPRPDILWFKNGEILNEEDFGITRYHLLHHIYLCSFKF